MAYTKQTWECGDVISAEKLNHMEDGIEASGVDYPIVVHFEKVDSNWTADKEYSELRTAIENGTPVKGCVKHNNGYFDNYYYMDMYSNDPMSINGRCIDSFSYNASSSPNANIQSVVVQMMPDNNINVTSTRIAFNADTSGSYITNL